MSDSPMYFYLPENLDLKPILCSKPRDWLDYAQYFVDLIFKGTHFANRASTGQYVSLKVKYLRKVITKKIVGPLRDHLKKSGVIEIDNKYKPGSFSMGYRLARKYRESRHRRITITNNKVKNRIRRIRNEQLYGMGEVQRYLHSQFKRVDVNLDDMMKIIRQHENELLLAERKYLPSLYLAADQLGHGDWLPHTCPYGRFHTPLTRLLSECRTAIRINGKRLVNLDIANSQPLFFAVILLQKYAESGHRIVPPFPSPSPALPSACPLPLPCPLGSAKSSRSADTGDVVLGGTGAGGSGMPDDVQRYLSLVQGGQLYDHLSANSGIPRKRLKVNIFKDVFFGNNHICTALTTAFKEQFPTVFGHIQKLKVRNYRQLAWLMQKAESELMINGVCRTLMHEHPSIVFLTIHDSVLTSPDHAETVKSVMLTEFAKLRLKPTIRTDSL